MALKTFLALLSLFSIDVSARLLEVELEGGKVRGGLCNNQTSSSSRFLGIPYAIPPTDRLRWESPLKWNGTFEGGILNATQYAPICYQWGTNDTSSEPGPYSEDCLFLNIWVPENAQNQTADLPVKVWIHGGANNIGSIKNPYYNGCGLSEKGAIVVDVAYRLGPLGFLALESAGIAGNFGIQDILLALQWVQDNIGKFGGDKDKVLLFGQSAGAWDTWIISTLPQAPSLIRGAAFESGGGVDMQTNSSAQLAGSAFSRSANCSVTDFGCLRRLSPQQLNEAFLRPTSPSLVGFTIIKPAIQPFVDGKVIPSQPSQVGIQVPAVFSTTSQEGTTFVTYIVSDPTNINETSVDDYLQTEFGPLADEVAAKYPTSDFENLPMPQFSRISEIITDYAWKCPAYRGLLRAEEKGIPAWNYIFDYLPTCSPLALPAEYIEILGASHGWDIPFFWAYTDGLPPPDGNCSYNEEEKRISNLLVDALTSVATSGNASTNQFEWPVFAAKDPRGLYIGPNATEISPLSSNYSICNFWNQINALLLEAAETNSTNVTEKIPPSPTITEGPISTESEPSMGFREIASVAKTSIVLALILGYIVVETI